MIQSHHYTACMSTSTWHLTSTVCCLNDLGVGGRIVCLDVRVDGLLHHGSLELGLGQLAPDSRLVATLGKLVGTVQVTNMVDQNLSIKPGKLIMMSVQSHAGKLKNG